MQKIIEIIEKPSNSLQSDELDKKSVLASINRYAFHSKQLPEPQGLYRATFALNSWLYGGDPMRDILQITKQLMHLKMAGKQISLKN